MTDDPISRIEAALKAEQGYYSEIATPCEALYEAACAMDEKRIAMIASIAHEANRAYCSALGDYSQLPWISAPQWQQDSAIAGVQAHLASDLTPEQSHEAWLAHKQADGWVYGPVKDPLAKQHPCCVPYDALPEEQRVKDRLFRNIVAAFKEPGE